jgi:hypothetical protein
VNRLPAERETWRYRYTVYDELATASRHASASSGSPADLTKSYVYDGLGRRTLEKTRNLAGNLTAATAWIYDGEQIAYEQQLRLDGSGTAVIPYASILCALPEAALACRITTRWYTPSDVTDDMSRQRLMWRPPLQAAPAKYYNVFRTPSRTGQVCRSQAESQIMLKDWCGRSESNRHSLRNGILSPARLPVPPRPHKHPAVFAGQRLDCIETGFKPKTQCELAEY